MKYDVTVMRAGNVSVEADTEAEADLIVGEMSVDEISWMDEFFISCTEEE